jgi:hypothetical protein
MSVRSRQDAAAIMRSQRSVSRNNCRDQKRALWVLKGHEGAILKVAIPGDSAYSASASGRRSVQLARVVDRQTASEWTSGDVHLASAPCRWRSEFRPTHRGFQRSSLRDVPDRVSVGQGREGEDRVSSGVGSPSVSRWACVVGVREGRATTLAREAEGERGRVAGHPIRPSRVDRSAESLTGR